MYLHSNKTFYFIVTIMNVYDQYFIILMIMFAIVRKRRRSNRWLRRRWLVRPLNQRREILGDYNNLYRELREDSTMFHRYLGMDVQTFDVLLALLTGRLSKSHPRALSHEQRLVMALRYLISGDQILSIALAYRIGESTMRNVIQEVCAAIIEILGPIFLRTPNEDEWRYIAADFLDKWNFPNCVAAIDAKHVTIQAPPNSGTNWFNYKKSNSTVLFAACDANYIFTLVHIGEMGSNSDAAIFADCPIGEQLKNGGLSLPRGTSHLPGSEIRIPCLFVGDDAFPLTTNLMKPYAGHYLSEDKRIFNYRLSRARRVIENAFGILASRFRVFRKPIAVLPESVDKIITASVCLHNFLKIRDDSLEPEERIYCPVHFVDWEDRNRFQHNGEWRTLSSCLNNINISDNDELQGPENAITMRNALTQYFLTPEGEVPWQYDHVRFAENLVDC